MRAARFLLALAALVLLAHCGASIEIADERVESAQSPLCVNEWSPTWQQSAGANTWWIDFSIGGGTVASASLEIVGGATIPLTRDAWNKWASGAPTAIATGTSVVLHAVDSTGKRAQTVPFPYLQTPTPATDPCQVAPPPPPPPACTFRPTLTQAAGANTWWVEFAISGSIRAASLRIVGGATITMTSAWGKWGGSAPAAIASGTQVVLRAEETSGAIAESVPFRYLVDAQPALTPCACVPACAGKQCGDDGCGGVCGTCAGGAACVAGACAPACVGYAPTWQQATANPWWIEYTMTSGAARAVRLEIAGGASINLTSQWGKWVGSAPSIASGTSVVLHAESPSGQVAKTVPFRYLVDTAPVTEPCAPPPGAPVAFPSTAPLLFGYTLQDAFPGAPISSPIDMAYPPGSTQPFVLQRPGQIVRLLGGNARTIALDFSAQVAGRSEGGALGMALHPKFADAVAPRPYVYVWYNREGNPTRQRLSRFTYNPAAGTFSLGSELVLVDQVESTIFHNGGRVRFGADGFLYFGNGDDTREVTTQTLTGGLFSGIFRIDVDSQGGAVSHPPPRQPTGATTQGYFIPNANPFVGVANANEEYFALGVRNPFGMSFDPATGALWLADVGDTFREEIDLVTAGGNYGWPFFDGTKRVKTGNPTIGTLRAPIYEHAHWSIGDLSSIIGGFVYRGAMPELAGRFIFSDWPTGRVWALDTATGQRTSLVETNLDQPIGFGQDGAGEVYYLSWSKIWKLVRAPAAHGVPAKLSATGLFASLATLEPAASVVPFDVRSPLYSDGAAKTRFVYVPGGASGTVAADGTITLPSGSLLIKHFELPPSAQPVGRTRRLETRVLAVGTGTVYGVTYRWNAAGTDADLVYEGVDETIADAVPAQSITWHYPSIGECWTCHRSDRRVLGFRGEQLNFPLPSGAGQLAHLASRGVLSAATIGASPPGLPSPSDGAASIDARAGAYFAANCAHCHRPPVTFLGDVSWNGLPGVAPAQRQLVNAPHHNAPMAIALGLGNAPLVSPRNPNGSILLARMKTTDRDLAMPPVGRTRVDPVGVSVVEAWINALP
ncbi:MAG: PQQ-dependent sugar dehydrogenase [Labilithrix sp.]|nr:PQQ-dependent sugar dehydrogenase [Labilithrix sp.]